jgi:hypothetical protein
VRVADQYGCTPFEIAVKFGLFRLFGALLKKGVCPLLALLSVTYCHLCCIMVSLLGSLLEHRSKNQYTPLHWAVYEDQVTCVKKLIKKGADINARSATGMN